MTLIVARKDLNTGKLKFVCDTRIFYKPQQSFSDALDFSQSDSVIKLTKLNEIAIGFAGDMDLAEMSINQLQDSDSIEIVLERLLNAHHNATKANIDLHFIIGQSKVNPDLYVIKDKKCEKVKAAWIGNSEAFSHFQKAISGLDIQNDLMSSMKSAMKSTIESNKFMDVGGHYLTLYQNKDSFSYDVYFETVGFPWVFDDKEKCYKVGKGTVVSGSCTLEYRELESNKHIFFFYHEPNILFVYEKKGNIYKLLLKEKYASRRLVLKKMNEFEEGFKFCWNFSS